MVKEVVARKLQENEGMIRETLEEGIEYLIKKVPTLQKRVTYTNLKPKNGAERREVYLEIINEGGLYSSPEEAVREISLEVGEDEDTVLTYVKEMQLFKGVEL